MKTITLFAILFFAAMQNGFTSVTDTPDGKKNMAVVAPELILVNHVGFKPQSEKIALLRVKAGKFAIVNCKSGKEVFTGKPGPLKYWEHSGDSVSTADFSTLTVPGTYQLVIGKNAVVSYPFVINRDVYSDIAKASLKAFYLNRSGMDIAEQYAGKWARAAGHPDTMVLVHASAATASRPEGTVISGPGGWYDAGDYNKYVVNSGITTYTLLLFCQMYPEYCKTLNGNIPESGNGIPDVYDELLYNLRWMLTMQDPADGGVYHKLTNKTFCDFVMPDKATDHRYVVMKSTAASLDFAATMAMASRVFAKTTYPELKMLSQTCLAVAERAYAWAKANPAVYYQNPSDISTGAYDDNQLNDEFFWASAEIGLATGNVSMVSGKEIMDQKIMVPSWDYSGMSGIVSLALSESTGFETQRNLAKKQLLMYADKLVSKAQQSPYHVSIDFFKWGSNSDVANIALLKLVAARISKNPVYYKSVQGDLDYLLGRNATSYCFVTGFGAKQVMQIHHRPSGADGITEPCPGFLAGGPNTIVLNDCPGITRSTFPAKSYTDSQCSYSTNEIAINWNAPLFFLLAAADAQDK